MSPSGRHLIDCHILTLPRFDPSWVLELRQDLEQAPVNQHWMDGIEGDLGSSRAAGFAAGTAPFLTSQDPDDRLLPGVYEALLKALVDNPCAPFAWAGEKLVYPDLQELENKQLRQNIWPTGYRPELHLSHGRHVHGVKLYRRELVMPLLEGMRKAGLCCEFFLDFALARPYDNQPRAVWPVHVPMVGRLWRQHPQNGSKKFTVEHFDQMAQALGFDSMAQMRSRRSGLRHCGR